MTSRAAPFVIVLGLVGCGKLLGLSEPEDPKPPASTTPDGGTDATTVDGSDESDGATDGDATTAASSWTCAPPTESASFDTQALCDEASKTDCGDLKPGRSCTDAGATAIACPTPCKDNSQAKYSYPRAVCVCR